DLDRELRAAGIDPVEVRARGEAIGREARREAARMLAGDAAGDPSAEGGRAAERAAEKKKKPAKIVRMQWAGLIAAAVAAVVASVGGVEAWLAPGAGVGSAPPSAERLREEGLDACARARWRECVARLDDAKKIDPAGDDRAAVRSARAAAEKALR
ncbi:MAG: hypothetical protein ACREJ3_14495, partial [Polyangiaceae bacterium]